MKIRSLAGVPFAQIHRAFEAAFSDYIEDVSLSSRQLQGVLERRGFSSELSFGAFEAGEIVGFIVNGIGTWNGIPTAYDCGTGVIKEFRQQGIASRIFDQSLPVLRQKGISQYLLEVIKTNHGAVELYRKSGFSVSREFDYWVSAAGALAVPPVALPPGMSIKPMETPDWNELATFWDYQPSWQNSVDSVSRRLDDMTLLGVYRQDAVVAYACMENESGDLPQLAVQPDFRRSGLATALIDQLLSRVDPPDLRVINSCANSMPMKHFLLNLGMDPGHGQYEMILKLKTN